MSVIEKIHRDHGDLARVLKNHPGIRRIVEDLYPDTAHFIYELLQNAEDVGASQATFFLSGSALVFEHNGRAFNEADIRAITDIAEGTKAEDEDQIGRFGIGFKAVFAYTGTPRIWSPTFAFEISEMVLPSEIPSNSDLAGITRFEFPFNCAKKPQDQAFSEVRDGLEEISDNTLLFLSNIEDIEWRIDGGGEGRLLRIQHSERHLEILREVDDRPTKSSHFLRFSEPVNELNRQFVAVAFELEQLSGKQPPDTSVSFTKQFRIVPTDPGCVAVYFTAAKETSNLRFHLHAPFVPELSRSSVKDTQANNPLFRQLAELVARSLFEIRDLDLLDRDFLAVLPNNQDSIPQRYSIIREAIVDAMKEKPLTPTHVAGHAPAGQLLQAEAELKNLLNHDDIHFLTDGDDNRRDWAIAATQRNNRVDSFLRDLDIEKWGVEQFVQILNKRLSNRRQFCNSTFTRNQEPDQPFLDWIREKSLDWHRKLYALFYREMETKLGQFSGVCIVRCSDGQFRTGSDCYFPTPEIQEDPIHPRVATDTFVGGTETERKRARAFLEGIGVRGVGEREQVEGILERRYADPHDPPPRKTHESDLRRFMDLTEKDGSAADLFKKYFIFQGSGDDWFCPSKLYLDRPYLDTGLRAYYSRLKSSEYARVPLSSNYQIFNSSTQLVDFARSCGVVERLHIHEVTCHDNPQREYLHKAPGMYWSHYRVDQDFVIPELDALFEKPDLGLSRLVWKTLSDYRNIEKILRATYQKNLSNEPHYTCSTLVHHLHDSAWIPQKNNESIKFVLPAEAAKDWLPDGFPFDSGWPWLAAIDFGAKTEERAAELQTRKELAAKLGFPNENALEDAIKFSRLAPDVRQRILAECASPVELPTNKSGNPELRAESVRKEARKAPGREKEKRQRSVSANRDPAKREKTDPYLRDQYTNSDNVTICQICQDGLPFKLSDGNYYFEAVEFLPELKKHHYQNYLILCPNHAAMFKHANDSRDEMKEQFEALDSNGLTITLTGRSVSLYFTDTHIVDLKAVISVDDEE